ncbi:hypothetical protein ACFY41_27970 [Streptomyces syringium]|uniref:hypothetical protein n=1 Tax=Streptomyces syringium TaxID=76729 RepID=UPI0036C8332B
MSERRGWTAGERRQKGRTLEYLASYEGWRNRDVEIPRTPGAPTLLEVRSMGWYSMFMAHGIEKTPQREVRGPVAALAIGRRPQRLLLGRKYTHVHIQRLSSSSSGGGFARWRVRVLSLEAAREISGTVRGRTNDVLWCPAGLRTVNFAFDRKTADGGSVITHMAPDGRTVTTVMEFGTVRGKMRIPGPGYLRIESLGPWEVST